jgi:uncharacterized protein YacL
VFSLSLSLDGKGYCPCFTHCPGDCWVVVLVFIMLLGLCGASYYKGYGIGDGNEDFKAAAHSLVVCVMFTFATAVPDHVAKKKRQVCRVKIGFCSLAFNALCLIAALLISNKHNEAAVSLTISSSISTFVWVAVSLSLNLTKKKSNKHGQSQIPLQSIAVAGEDEKPTASLHVNLLVTQLLLLSIPLMLLLPTLLLLPPIPVKKF